MFAFLVLLVLTVILDIKILLNQRKHNHAKELELMRLKEKNYKLAAEASSIHDGNAKLKHALDETIAFYEVTKDICRYLEVERVFEVFSEKLKNMIDVKECIFLKPQDDLSRFSDYTVVPLRLGKVQIGNLLVSQVKEKDLEKFSILVQQFIMGAKRALLYQRIQELATHDSLTGVLTRRYWFQRCQEELQRSKKFAYKVSCLMMDVDHFKDFNDKYGHLVGDAILVKVASVIKENVRQIDLVGKYGGEEFCVILTETDLAGAKFVAERIRGALQESEVKAYDESLKVTISIGISCFPEHSVELSRLVDKSDQALYQAKEQGRNKVNIYGSRI